VAVATDFGWGRDAVVMVLAVARRVCVPFPPLHSIVGGFLRKLLLAFGEEWCSLKCLSGMLFAFPVVGVIAAADVGSGGGVFLKKL